MATSTDETSPLLGENSASSSNTRPNRTVTFTSEAPTTTQDEAAPQKPTRPSAVTNPTFPSPQQSQPMLSTLNSKLRRRNSHGSPLSTPSVIPPGAKIGPQRTTKTAQKLKLLPNPDPGDSPDEESGRDVYSQFTRIKDPTARRDAARLGKADRERLPRVTAYCTANSYRLDALMKFLKGRSKTRGTNPKQFDECIYSPFRYDKVTRKGAPSQNAAGAAENLDLGEPSYTPDRDRRKSDSALEVEETTHNRRDELMAFSSGTGDYDPSSNRSALHGSGEHSLEVNEMHTAASDFDTEVHTPEVFLFDYGTVVIWGMTLVEEKRFLKDIAKFETEKLGEDDVQTEDFNFYYTREYQARIYNDFISLRDKRNYMTKLAISHALAQSVKTSLFEDLLSTTIADTTPLPALLATTGSISLSRKEINKKIGELFILRINIHLQGSVLDSPELMWAEPQLEPVYSAMRGYLEMDQRVELMTERLSVLGDLLAVLKDQVGTRHGEVLEWIVIVLIAAEILVAAINIVVDLYAGVD